MVQIVEQVEKDRTVLTLSGRLNIQARKPLQMAIKKVQSTHAHHLTLNLTKVTFIDSSAIGILILAHRALEEGRTKLSLIVPPGTVLDTLHLMNIDSMIPIHSTDPATTTPSPTHR